MKKKSDMCFSNHNSKDLLVKNETSREEHLKLEASSGGLAALYGEVLSNY